MIKKTLLTGIFTIILLTQCKEEKDSFLLSKESIGPLNKTTLIKQVDSIFALDSIVRLNPVKNSLGTQGEVEIYEKGGNKLLLISPRNEKDPNSLISNVQIFDKRFKTEKGLNPMSTWADVKANYKIENIQNAINSVVVFLKDSNIYITIDKKQLPENIRYNYTAKIEVTQIPDTATFKYFMIGWEADNETIKNSK